MAWVTAQDVIDSWIGSDGPTDAASIDTWIGKAERYVRSPAGVPDLQARLDVEAALDPPATELLGAVRDVVIELVEGKFRNPEGVRTRQESTGPFSGSVTLGGDKPGEFFLTDEQRKRLGAVGAGSGKAFSVDMIPNYSPYAAAPINPATYPW